MKYQFRIILLFIMMGMKTGAQIVLKITAVPNNTPANGQIFMASSLNNWNPHDEIFKFEKEPDGNFYLKIPAAALYGSNAVEYKLTLGSWEKCEGDGAGKPIQNRKVTLPPAQPEQEVKILSWVNPPEKQNTASGNVRILSEKFCVPQLKTTRKIWIYLPKDYTASTKKYPVIYMEDGQNLFSEATAAYGEWRVDETLDKAFSDGEKQAIIIGIDNGNLERLNEYSPWKNMKYGGGKGSQYADFLANTLKPFIDKNYRTLPQARYTGLIGSSMGGLISFYTGLKYPAKFGRMGIFSPSFWFAKNELKFFINKNAKRLKNSKFYFLAGKNESEEMVPDILEIVPMLEQKGVPDESIMTKFDDYGTHSEAYWSKEFGAAYSWLMRD